MPTQTLSITADYFIVKPGVFNLTNTERIKDPMSGTIETYTGSLVNYDPSQPGKWEIMAQIPGFYWVVAVGTPVDGKYPWAVVSEPHGVSNFVLARDVKTFYSMYQSAVETVLQKEGFIRYWNRIRPTYQLGNCNYSW